MGGESEDGDCDEVMCIGGWGEPGGYITGYPLPY